MKLQYRIKEWQFPFAESYFTAQYKVLGLWLNIGMTGKGYFTHVNSVICEDYEEAQRRINTYKRNMERAKEIPYRFGNIVWESENNKKEDKQ